MSDEYTPLTESELNKRNHGDTLGQCGLKQRD